jgi:hypothetical protein
VTASSLSIAGTTRAVADASPANDRPIVCEHGQEAPTGATPSYFKVSNSEQISELALLYFVHQRT